MADKKTKERTMENILKPMLKQMMDICDEVGLPVVCAVQTADSEDGEPAAFTVVAGDTQAAAPLSLVKDLFSGDVSIARVGIGEYSLSVKNELPMFVPKNQICH